MPARLVFNPGHHINLLLDYGMDHFSKACRLDKYGSFLQCLQACAIQRSPHGHGHCIHKQLCWTEFLPWAKYAQNSLPCLWASDPSTMFWVISHPFSLGLVNHLMCPLWVISYSRARMFGRAPTPTMQYADKVCQPIVKDAQDLVNSPGWQRKSSSYWARN